MFSRNAIISGNGCDDYLGIGWTSQSGQPQVMTVYRTAGFWETDFYPDLHGNLAGFFDRVRRYRTGRSYLDLVGAAVVGPSDSGPAGAFPSLQGSYFEMRVSSISDPVMTGGSCCYRTTGTLAIGGRVIRRWQSWRIKSGWFHTVLTKKGWYSLTQASRRFNPYGPEPAGLLSPRITLAWHFHVTPTSGGGAGHESPVTMTTFLPAGLDLTNAAPASGTTPLRMQVVRSGDPKYRLTTIRLMVSSDDGQTWQPVPVTAHHGFWLAQVPDPASGFVSLRSVVTDAHGDSTTETIYHAYAIS